MRNECFFKHDLLPFAEARYSRGSTAPFKPHMHRSFSIGAVNSGEVVYQVKGKAAPLAPGSLAIINPETLHACNPVGGKGRSYSMLYLSLFTVMVSKQTGLSTRCLYALWMMSVVFFWDCFVILVVGRERGKKWLENSVHIVEKTAGVALVIFGIILPFS